MDVDLSPSAVGNLRKTQASGLLVGLALIAAMACAPWANAQVNPLELKTTLVAQAKQHDVCAAAVAAFEHRQMVFMDAVNACDDKLTVSTDSVFQAASLSKPMFAYAVVKLARQGQLDLDKPLLGYLPQGYQHRRLPIDARLADTAVNVSAPELGLVTARMVLHHTSGLPNWASGPLQFDFEPGKHWQYSGEGFVLLQRVVEQITGTDLQQAMQGLVFGPLGMQHSSMVWSDGLKPHFVTGSKGSAQPVKPVRFELPLAPASLYTSIADYARFVQAVLNDAPLLAQIVDAPVVVDATLGLSWGLGWALEQRDHGSTLWHWGNNPGYRSFVMLDPASGDALVLLTNSEGGLRMAAPLTRTVLPGAHQAFKFHLLSDGSESAVCRWFGWCR